MKKIDYLKLWLNKEKIGYKSQRLFKKQLPKNVKGALNIFVLKN